jgi:hypothetical protein
MSWLLVAAGIFKSTKCKNGPLTALDHAVMISGYGRDPATGREYWCVSCLLQMLHLFVRQGRMCCADVNVRNVRKAARHESSNRAIVYSYDHRLIHAGWSRTFGRRTGVREDTFGLTWITTAAHRCCQNMLIWTCTRPNCCCSAIDCEFLRHHKVPLFRA